MRREEIFKVFNINKILSIVFVASLGTSAAVLLNSFLEYKFFSLPPENIKPVHVKQPENRDYSYISSIFQKKEESPVIVEKKEKKKRIVSSKTSLGNISLVGTILINKEKYALIKKGNNPQIVKEGTTLDGFKVEEIGKYYILLTKGNISYKLTVKVESKNSKISSRKYYRRKKGTSEGVQTYKLDRRFVEEQTADIGNLLKDVFIVPVIRNGETVGFKFRYIKPGSLLYKYGLRSGDLILSVNDRPVRTVEEAFKIYNILRNESTVKVEIERRGKRKTIIYEIR